MREALAGWIVITMGLATLWPADVGTSLGRIANKFATAFSAAYHEQR